MTESKPASRTGFGLSLKGRALRYLAAREHSRTELERKLRPHEQTPGQLAQVLDDLQAKDFISEPRLVESVLHRRASRMGSLRIKYDLQAKGVSAAAIVQALAGLQATELTRAQDVWRRRFKQPPQEAHERAKQMRFLAARGFSGDVVRRVVQGGGRDEDESGGSDEMGES